MTLQAHLITLLFSFLLMLYWKSWPYPTLPLSLQFTHLLSPHHHPVCSVFTFKLRIPLKMALSLKNVFCKLCSFLIFLHNFCICWHQLITFLSIQTYLESILRWIHIQNQLHHQQLSKHEKDTLILLNLGVLNYEMENVRLKWPVYIARDQAVVAISTISRPFEGVRYKRKMKVQESPNQSTKQIHF